MKFFVDTAKVEDIRKANDMGIICGVTTNPSLIAKEGRDFNEVIKELERISNKSWVLLIRLHPNDIARSGQISFTENILNASPYPDTQDLTKAADLLITDYSSIMYDFALQRKQVVLFAPDLEFYEKTRGLRSIFYELPFPLAQKSEEMSLSLQKAFSTEYPELLRKFLQERVCSFDDGHASERIATRIKAIIDGTFHGIQ